VTQSEVTVSHQWWGPYDFILWIFVSSPYHNCACSKM